MVLTYSDQLDERHGEVVLMRHVCVHALLVDAGQGEAQQRQQRCYGEAEVELDQTWELRPGLYLQQGGDMERTKNVKRPVMRINFHWDQSLQVRASQRSISQVKTAAEESEYKHSRAEGFMGLSFMCSLKLICLLLNLCIKPSITPTELAPVFLWFITLCKKKLNLTFSFVSAAAAHRSTWCWDQLLMSGPQVWR